MSKLFFNRPMRAGGVALLGVLLSVTAATAYGATLVTPDPILVNTEGNSSSTRPIGLSVTPVLEYQQVFGSSLFGTSPVLISSFAFRLDVGYVPGPISPINLTSLQVIMSTTSAGVDGLSTTLASNLGGDQTVVINNPSGFSQPSTTVKTNGITYDFNYVFTFATPFLYDPTQGNLLFDIQSTFGAGFWNNAFDATLSNTDQTSTAFTTSGTPATSTLGLVVQFTYTTPTPEPEMLSLLFASLMGLGALRYASSRKK